MVFILIFVDNRLEELQKKYYQEVEERKKLETELKVLQVKVSYIAFISLSISLQLIIFIFSFSC